MAVFELPTVRCKRSTGADCSWVGLNFRRPGDKTTYSYTQDYVNEHVEILIAKHKLYIACTLIYNAKTEV